jgi:nucleotidyltransferase/DNA polymerase involved in DNA repair
VSAKRVIAHLDCDAFYATVELLRRPELVGQPVIVAGSGPRAVVTTASYEARRYGIGSAMPATRARRLCPDAVVIPPDFGAYRATSIAVWDVVRERLDRVQQMGLDEAYADLTGVEKPLRVLRELLAEVKQRTGITVSAGVGPSRLVAKCCSDLGKPAGFVAMGREEACVRFASAPTSRVPGIGPKTADRLAELGLRTVGQLQGADEALLAARFGARTAGFLKARAQFRDDSRRPSHARPRPPSTRTSATSRRSSRCCAASPPTSARACAVAAAAAARSPSRCGWTTGPRSPAPVRWRRPRTTPSSSPASHSSSCAPTRRRGRCACWASAWPPSRTSSSRRAAPRRCPAGSSSCRCRPAWISGSPPVGPAAASGPAGRSRSA